MSELNVGIFGEVQPHREDPETAFRHLQPLVDECDVNICQLETSFSTKGDHQMSVAYPGHQVPPENVEALAAGGIDVVTFASNTSMEYGGESMLETIDFLNDHGVEVAGAGETIEAARAPVYITRNDTTLGIVNACTVGLEPEDIATEDSPGVAPLRVSAFSEYPDDAPGNENPGMQEVVKTVPELEDLEALRESVREANRNADHVVTALHWGVPWVHDIAWYQPDVAYDLIDAGADTIVGTHPHTLQPVDRHEGRPIFYSMANCVFDEPHLTTDDYTSSFVEYYDMYTDEETDNYISPKHTKDSIFAKLTFSGEDPDLELTPIYINTEADPEPVSVDDEHGQRIFAVLDAISDDIGVTLARDGDRIVIEEADGDARKEIRKRVLSFPWTYKLREEVYLDRSFSFDDWY